METIVMKLYNLIIAPLLVFILPLKLALITLGIFFLLNIILKTIKSVRKRKIKWFRIDKFIDQEIIDYILKTSTSYAITITTMSFFELFVIGLQSIDLVGSVVTLTRIIVIFATAQQLGQVMQTLEDMTNYNLVESIAEFLPSSLQKLFNKAFNKNGVINKEDETKDEKD